MSQISTITNRASIRLSIIALGAALAFTPALASAKANEEDNDHDQVADSEDNCVPRIGWTGTEWKRAKNPDQLDTDNDGIGNVCDCDYDQDENVGYTDFGIFFLVHDLVNEGWLAWNEVFEIPQEGYTLEVTPTLMDHNGDGELNELDFTLLLEAWGSPPGPSNAN